MKILLPKTRLIKMIPQKKLIAMIEIKGIEVQKGRNTIVKNASFEIRPGQISVVVGKNGAGKSTLLEALTGKNLLSKGKIRWDDQPIDRLDAATLAIRRAVLSQKVEISFSISVQQLVEMGTYVANEALSNAKIKNLTHHALEEVAMMDFIDRDFSSLSGGEQKRVLLAKCIVQLNCCHWGNVNKYLFLDEPTASLDIEQQYKFIALVKRFIKRRNIGVFAVLHDINLAAQFADQIIMLRDGEIIEKGTPRAVFTPDKIRAAFDVKAIVHQHPVYDCPLVTTLPQQATVLAHSF